jgi:translation initiation factor IF-3
MHQMPVGIRIKYYYLEVAIQKTFYRINHQILDNQLRVVDDQAKQIGIMTKSEAIAVAEEEGKDLVLVNPAASPPVAKIISYSKFKYQIQQKESDSKKSSKSVDIKEVRFTPFIAEGDFNIRIKKAREFLADGNKVKLNVKFTGRQITRKEFGDRIVNKAIEQLTDIASVERAPQLMGKMLIVQLQPKRKAT